MTVDDAIVGDPKRVVDVVVAFDEFDLREKITQLSQKDLILI